MTHNPDRGKKSHLEDVLEEVVGNGKLLTIQPGGNHGDELIYKGFHIIAEELGIEIVPFDEGANRNDCPPRVPSENVFQNLDWVTTQLSYLYHSEISDCSAVYIQGGGNFNDLWGSSLRGFNAVARYFDCPIIVGPQSFYFQSTDPTEIFSNVSNQVHLFSRERQSYRIIDEAAKGFENIHVYLNKDTALYNTIDQLPNDSIDNKYSLIAMRSDRESTRPIISEDIEEPVYVSDISIEADSFDEWVDAVSNASKIYTDRMHVAILGHILQKQVNWYDVGYHKSIGVYEYSLDAEENIQFIPLE